MDLSNEKDSGSIEPSSRDPPSELGISGLKSCTDCRTTKTPLWRGGPSGPKSLCNACGIRYRKKRRAVLGLKERRVGGEGKERREEASIKMVRMLGLGRDLLKKQRSVFHNQKKQRMLGEEEEAAVLLMALSSGCLYA